MPSVAHYSAPNFGDYVFTMNEYVQVAITDSTQCVVFVHRILYKQDEDEKAQYYLLVSRYSFLESFPPMSYAGELMGPVTRKELLLHFTDFATMGTSRDAEIIPIDHILEAKALEFEPAPNADPVQLVAHAPEGMNCILRFLSDKA